MYKTTTFFIKAQTPGISIPVLLELYKQELEFIVTLSANMSRMLNKAGVITGIVILVMLFCRVFNEYSIFFGLFIFLAALGIMYVQTGLFFSVYFNALRRKIESMLQNNTFIQ